MWRVAALFFVLATPTAALSEPPAQGAQLSNAQQLELAGLLRRAREAYQSGDFNQALLTYQSAYAILPQPDILYQIALCHDKSEQLVEARDAYLSYLAADEQSGRRGQVEARIETLNERIERAQRGVLEITVTPEDAEIFIDDEPLLERPARLDDLSPERPVRVRVEAPGHLTSQLEVKPEAGQTRQLDVVLTPRPEVAVAAAPQRDGGGSGAGGGGGGATLWIVSGLSGAGALGFGAANLLGARRLEQTERACRAPATASCPYDEKDPVREEFKAQRRRHNVFGLTAIGLGAVGLATGLLAWRARAPLDDPGELQASLHLSARSLQLRLIW